MNKLIPYKEDQYLTLSHYKEPLLPVKKGYGYYGALSALVDGSGVQCHICGETFGELGKHLIRHKLTASEYKDRFQLARTTPLISENVRQERKMRTIKWLNSLTPEERMAYRKKAKDKLKKYNESKKTQFKIRLETKNKRGTCPQQLLEKIKECSIALKKTPTKLEFIEYCGTQRYVHLIYKTHGSWVKALKMLKLQPVTQVQKGGKTRRYDDEELLEYLKIFYQEEGRVPTGTDCRRGLIPDSAIYKRRFGSMQEARELAGIYEEVGNTTRKGISYITSQ